MEHFIGNKFEKKEAKISLDEIYEHQLCVLFFGAYWSPPCKKLIPHLKSLYAELNYNEKFIEIIYISCDFTESDFYEFSSNMPWSYIPFTETGLREIVTRHYEVIGIPTLLLIDNLGTCISDSLITDLATLENDQCKDLWLKKLKESAGSL